jgi:hypothetical protein
VANSCVARLFERGSLQQPWVEIQDWWHAEGRMHTGDLDRMSQGHSLAGRTGLALHTHIRHRERVEFSHDLAQGLKHALDWTTLTTQEIETRWRKEFRL